SLGDKGYVGLGASDVFYNDFWEYNPTSDTWTKKADFPAIGRQAGIAFAANNKIYVGLGINMYTAFSDLYEYDPATNAWTKKADYPGGVRYTSMAFSIGNKGYVGCGKDEQFYLGRNDFYEYDPATDVWTKKADVGPVRRSIGVGFSIGNKGYIGLGAENYDTRKKDLWEYDPATDTWVQKADLPSTERYAPFSFTIGGLGYVGSGYYYSVLSDVWAYDPATNAWTQKADIPVPRGQPVSFGIGNKGYVGLGYELPDFWEYNPVCTLNVKLPGVYALHPGGDSNTIYLGYGPSSLTLQANVSGGQLGTYTYLWSTGATSSSLVVNPSVPGSYVYSVVINDNRGCTGTASITIKVVDVRCGNNKVIICRVPPGNPGNRKTLCVNGNAVSAHLKNGSFLGDCGEGSVSKGSAEVVVESRSNTDLVVYPNPNNGVFVVQVNNWPGGNGSIEIIDQGGRIIIKKNINLSKGSQVIPFDITPAEGVYLLKLTNNKKIISTKLLVR
ncbi:MAG: kelch repeat-containing protein, partial [Flavitalea sp.]